MYIRNVLAGLEQAVPGESFGLSPTVQEYMIADDIEFTEDDAAAITSDVISFLHQHFGQNLDYLAINIDGTRYGMVGKGTSIDPALVEELGPKVKNFLINEYNRENNGNDKTED